jgi:hypothetical protein
MERRMMKLASPQIHSIDTSSTKHGNKRKAHVSHAFIPPSSEQQFQCKEVISDEISNAFRDDPVSENGATLRDLGPQPEESTFRNSRTFSRTVSNEKDTDLFDSNYNLVQLDPSVIPESQPQSQAVDHRILCAEHFADSVGAGRSATNTEKQPQYSSMVLEPSAHSLDHSLYCPCLLRKLSRGIFLPPSGSTLPFLYIAHSCFPDSLDVDTVLPHKGTVRKSKI